MPVKSDLIVDHEFVMKMGLSSLFMILYIHRAIPPLPAHQFDKIGIRTFTNSHVVGKYLYWQHPITKGYWRLKWEPLRQPYPARGAPITVPIGVVKVSLAKGKLRDKVIAAVDTTYAAIGIKF